MSITSLTFGAFLFFTLGAYWIVPKRFQWYVLLGCSILFYISGGASGALYILITATSIYAATLLMQLVSDKQKAYLKANKAILTKEEKAKYKHRNQRIRKAILVLCLLGNLGILGVFKYFHFALSQVNAVIALLGLNAIPDTFEFAMPLGISFYTFQAIGYLADVYWEHYRPEKNYLKVLLFVSFFPQITQGPISNFESLSNELFTPHTFSYKNYSYGMQRLLWGFGKKLLIANVMDVYVTTLFNNYDHYTGITALLGAFCYSIQIYADFSGYMDIMCGLCEAMGITLRENFDRPYFSKSIAEYWRRWHISLGDWFKSYIYYPIGMSNWSRKLAKYLRAHTAPHFANTFPATIALLVVWSATGLWHGATWGYIFWGLLNGVFIIFSMWMEPVYAGIKKRLGIRDDSRLFQLFQIIRTFFLVTLIKVLPEVGGLRKGLGLWKQIFTEHRIPADWKQLLEFVQTPMIWFWLAMTGTALMFTVSVLQSSGPVRPRFNRLPVPLRLLVEAVCLLLIISFGGMAMYTFGGGGFLYAGF